jgi:uncharacterized damage-inducible protein DinB
VFQRVIESQNAVSWSPEALAEDARRGRLAVFGYVAVAILSVAAVAAGYWLWKGGGCDVMTRADSYRRWFDYERDAHAKVVASLETVPADRRSAPEYRRAVGLLEHVAGARQVWLYRFGVAPSPPAGGLSGTGADLAEVAARLADVEATWADYLARLDDADLDRVFEYQSYDAGRFKNRVEDILTQLFGHSWYHRGQIAMLVRAAGGEPAVTDLVYWCRERI